MMTGNAYKRLRQAKRMAFDYRVVVQSLANKMGYRILSVRDPVVDRDQRFQKVYRRSKPYTMTSKERMYALYKAVVYVVESKIPGDFVECGVWKGGSAMLIADTLREMGIANRKIWLYDTFEGMAQPTEADRLVSNTRIRASSKWKKDQRSTHNESCYVPLEEVKRNMVSTGYDEGRFVYVKGKVEDTIPQEAPKRIALLRLDTDWYESTKHELEHLYPRVSVGGVLIIDDYGFWAGSKRAVDEYFADGGMLLNRVEADGRI